MPLSSLGFADGSLPGDANGLFFSVAACAFISALAIVLSKRWHGRFSLDGSIGVQKKHVLPTPRIGGIAIYAGVLTAAFMAEDEASAIFWAILGAGFPAFLAGLIEDVTKTVSPKARLVATILSGTIFGVGLGYAFDLADLQWVSWLWPVDLLIYAFAAVVVAVGMGGVANAVNIIDGYHGLASGCLVIMHLFFAAIALSAGDAPMTTVALTLAAATAGFMLVNFPLGKLFLGDAGAYFSGFALAAVAVLIPARNEIISPFVSVLVVFYPIWETLFSILRKRKRVGSSPDQPDGVHLHMLMNRSGARILVPSPAASNLRNAVTGMLMWPLPVVCGMAALLSQGSGRMAVLSCVIFVMLYGRIYNLMSLRRTPVLTALQRRASSVEGR